MDRRRFVLTCAAVPFAGACVRYQYVTGRTEAGHVIVPRSALQGQPYALVETDAVPFPIFVHESAPGAFTAVLTRCMHRGCTVEPSDGHLVCPCHGSEYSNAGDILKGPTEKPLIRFAVRSDGDHITILDVKNGTTGGTV